MGMNSFSAVNNILVNACLVFGCYRYNLEQCIKQATDEDLDLLHKAYLEMNKVEGIRIINKYR